MGGHEEDVNSIEITNYDLERMRGAPPQDRYAKFLRKKEELRALSKERYKKWPNTITAIREKRLADRKRELERIEEELCKQDAVDAQNRAERRRQQIAKANKMLQVAHLSKARTRLLMSHILEERDAQLQYRDHMDKLWQKQEDKWADFQRKQREGWKEEEAAEEQKHRENVQKLKSGRLEQLEERGRHLQRLKEQKEQEKMQLRKQLEEDEQRAKQKEDAKRKKIQESKEDFIASNMAQKARKEAEKLRLKESDRKIAEFATYRDRVEQERKEAYAKKQAEENARRDVILTRLEKQLLEARVDNESRLQNQAAAHKEAEDRREQERAERARADWEQCDISRKQQISMRKEQLARDKSDDMEEAMGVRERIKSVEAEEKAELRKTRERNTVFAKENLRLAAERQEHECREREEEKRDYQNAYELMEHNDVPDDLLLTDDD